MASIVFFSTLAGCVDRWIILMSASCVQGTVVFKEVFPLHFQSCCMVHNLEMRRHVISSNQRHSFRKDNPLRIHKNTKHKNSQMNILTTSERQKVVRSSISILSGIKWQVMVVKAILLKHLKDKFYLIYEQRKYQCYKVIKTYPGLCCTVYFYILIYTMCAMNIIGPSTEPCGTPRLIVTECDNQSF